MQSELIIMAPLRHENLVQLHGGVWKEGADKLCIVLEFCARGSLDAGAFPFMWTALQSTATPSRLGRGTAC